MQSLCTNTFVSRIMTIIIFFFLLIIPRQHRLLGAIRYCQELYGVGLVRLLETRVRVQGFCH